MAVVASGCGSSEKIAYMQGIETMTPEEFAQVAPLYDARIMPKDLLTIVVSTTDPEASRPFNLVTPTISTGLTTTAAMANCRPTWWTTMVRLTFPWWGQLP